MLPSLLLTLTVCLLVGLPSLHVREYQSVLANALEELDAKRLEYDESMFGNTRKPIAGFHKGTAYRENYTPSVDIKEFYKAAGREPTLFDKFVRETLSKNNLKKTDFVPAERIQKI